MSLSLSTSLAAQCIDVGSQIVSRLKEFSKDGTNPPEPFRKISTTLPIITQGFLRIQTELNSGQSASNTPEIRSFLGNALKDLERLQDRLEKALPQQGESRWRKHYKAVQSMFREDEIMGIASNVEHYMSVWQHIESTTSWRTRPQTTLSSGPFWVVPPNRNECFSGREDTLRQIETMFGNFKSSQPRVALCGLGGIGKTQIAIEYCHRKQKTDGECSVFWINAASISRFEASLHHIASACHLVQPGSSEAGLISILKEWLEFHHRTPWLMVIDNVDDRNMFFYEKTRSGSSCMECIPKCEHGSLLFTTRSYEVAVDLAGETKPIEIPKMPQEAGAMFVKLRLGAGSLETENDTMELLEVLDNIPLAITQALSLINKRKWTIRQYIDRYTTSDEYKIKLLGHEFMDSTRDSGTLESVLKTWILSFNIIKKESPNAADIMFLVSFLQNQSLPQALLEAASEDELEFEDAIECLIGFSFLERETPATFRTHHMVQIATKLWLKEQGSLVVDDWNTKALEAVSQKFPDMRSVYGPTYQRDCETLMPHVESVLATPTSQQSEAKSCLVERARLLRNSGRYLHSIGYHDESILRFKASLEICSNHLGEKHIDTMDSAGVLGWALFLRGESEATQSILEPVLRNRTDILGEDDPRTIDCLSDLATALIETDPERSESMHRDAYGRSLRILGPEHEDTLNCMEGLAGFLYEHDRFVESEELYREAVQIRTNVFGTDHVTTLIAEHQLAYCLRSMEDRGDEAMEIYKSCLAKKERVFGYDHRETLATAWNYASDLSDEDKYSDALRICEHTLQNAAGGLRGNVSESRKLLNKISDLRETLQERLHTSDESDS